MSFVINVEEPKVDFSLFECSVREEGLSGFIRARNEGEFLADSIESWLPLLDELIIVFNNCQDNTEEVAEEYARKYPDKIKVFHYNPIVYPQGSEKYKLLAENDQHSLVNYYNFALSKTTKKWAIKIDGDLILIPEMVKFLREKYTLLSQNETDSYLPVSGINVILENEEFYVPSSSKFCGTGGDLCIFRVDSDSIFRKSAEVEYLDLSKRVKLDNVFAYYHLKFIKSDYGVGNYELDENPKSRYLYKAIIFLYTLKLVKLDMFINEYKERERCIGRFTLLPLLILKPKMEARSSYKKQALTYLKFDYKKLFVKEFVFEIFLYLYHKIKGTKIFKKMRKVPVLVKIGKKLLGK